MLKKLAPKIASSISQAIGYEVFITDEKAFLIGASENSRLGTFHEVAYKVITCRNKNQYKYIKNKEGEKKGIILPIKLAGNIVGSIGIMGSSQELDKFGILVKSQAEVMIWEEIFYDSTLLREQALKNLMQEISSFDSQKTEEFVLIAKGYKLGYDLKPPHIAIAVEYVDRNLSKLKIKEIDNYRELYSKSVEIEILSKIKNIFNKPEDIITPLGNDRFIILKLLKFNYDELEVLHEIKELCDRMRVRLLEKRITVNIGIGSIAKNITNISKSYHESFKAIEIGKRVKPELGIYMVNDFRMESLILNADKDVCESFISNALKNLKKQSDWIDLSKTVKAWCECRFSQVEAAKELFIHRNTLNHRLNKISKLSGINIKNFKEAIILYFAVMMDELLQ